MQLPETLSFSEPTLIVRCDHFHAEFYMADGTLLEQLETMSREKEQFTDNEASNANAGTSAYDGKEALKLFSKRIAEGLTLLKRDGGLERVYLICESEMNNYLQEALPADVKNLIKRYLPLNLMKENILEVVKRARAA